MSENTDFELQKKYEKLVADYEELKLAVKLYCEEVVHICIFFQWKAFIIPYSENSTNKEQLLKNEILEAEKEQLVSQVKE